MKHKGALGMSKLVLRLVTLLCVFGSAVAAGNDYWPMVNGAVYTYETANGSELVATYGDSTRSAAATYSSFGWYSEYGVFFDGDGDDVKMRFYSAMGYGGVDPDEWPYCPGFIYFDFPFYVGKAWTSETYRCWDEQWPIIIRGEVIREETITVPLGTYDVFVVEMSGEYGAPSGHTYYLNMELGPVRIDDFELISATGTVSVESQTWGGLKALYR
jgi:hypothetical protein